MSKEKGMLGKLFGGKQQGSCCNMEIVEEPERDGTCCDSAGTTECCVNNKPASAENEGCCGTAPQ